MGLVFDVEREGDLPRERERPDRPMQTANVTSAAPVEMDYKRSKRRGTVPAGLPHVVVTNVDGVFDRRDGRGSRRLAFGDARRLTPG